MDREDIEQDRADYERDRRKDERTVGPTLEVYRPHTTRWLSRGREIKSLGPVFSTREAADWWVNERLRDGANTGTVYRLMLNQRQRREINYYHPSVVTGFGPDGAPEVSE